LAGRWQAAARWSKFLDFGETYVSELSTRTSAR
jgi:hypothetical protein